jgi:hypothetical protein
MLRLQGDKCKNTNIFILCCDHSRVKILWFWLKFQLIGKTVMHMILEVKNGFFSMIMRNDVHSRLMILIGE